jgi:hypothetical protein
MTPPASSQQGQPAIAKPRARRGLPSLAPLKSTIGYTHQQVPAFLPPKSSPAGGRVPAEASAHGGFGDDPTRGDPRCRPDMPTVTCGNVL